MLNKKIKQIKGYHVVRKDITNDEELIELLERGEKVDILFLCSRIIKNYKVDELIKIIRKLQSEILVFFFKMEGAESNLKEDKTLKVFQNLEIDWDVFETILEKTIYEKIEKPTAKIVAVSGTNGVGKSTFSTFLAKNVENSAEKILLVDFDLAENQIRTILKIKKKPEYSNNIEDMIINFNKNLDVLCHLDFIFLNKNKIDIFGIQEILNQLKEKYDFIIIDTSSNLKNEYTKRIFYNSNHIIFLLEPNIIGIKKSQDILEVFEKDWKIKNSKIKLILNKTNMYQIADSIICELFPDNKLIGKMKYNDSYNLMINKNINKREIKREYETIYKKIKEQKN